MALYHLTVSQIRRSAGQSAIAAAAYRAGECLYSDYYGEYSDYTRKGGVICSEILLPPHAPLEYQDRATLWNTVEQVEKHKKAQLAYSFDIPKSAWPTFPHRYKRTSQNIIPTPLPRKSTPNRCRKRCEGRP